MQKTPPSLGRLLVMVTFALSCFGLLLFLWLAFGGPTPLKPKGYRVTVSFAEGTQLAQEADVRISGVPVGKVKEIVTDAASGRADATIELRSAYAPLPSDARAVLRAKTLLGETYVELTPGTRGAPAIPENGRLATGQVGATVELDEILRALDAPTRERLQTWLQTQAQGVRGRGRDLNEALAHLEPFAQDTRRLVGVLRSQTAAVQRLVADGGEVFDALSERRGQLRRLIDGSERVFSVTAQRDAELGDAIRALPSFQREADRTITRLSAFARDTDPLVRQLRPAARALSPALTGLAALAPDLRGLFTDLDPAITASRRGLPALERFLGDLRPFLGQFEPALRQLNPILAFLGRFPDELTAFAANSVAATGAQSGGVHYLRTTQPLNAESLAAYPRRLGTNRPNAYRTPGGYRQLASGLPSLDTRHCGGPIARLGNTEGLSEDLVERVRKYALADDVPTAPPCLTQAPMEFQGRTTQFPQVRAAATATTARARG